MLSRGEIVPLLRAPSIGATEVLTVGSTAGAVVPSSSVMSPGYLPLSSGEETLFEIV